MRQNCTAFNISTCFTILIIGNLAGCNATLPDKTDSDAPLTGQKPIQGKLPPSMTPSPPWTVKNAFSYDFNRDGKPDRVTVYYNITHDDWMEHDLNINMSQPDGKYQTLINSHFDPSEKGDVPWRMSVKLTGSGDLRITNNKYTPLGGSDTQNGYRFRFINGEFVLQEYTHGYGSSSRGSSYIFDLANHVYREQQAGRCDYAPEQPCPGAKKVKLGSIPKITLRDFGGYYALGTASLPVMGGSAPDNMRFFQKYILK